MAKRPKPAELADVRITVVRGPHKDNPASWYWRARTKGANQRTVWTGWGTRDEVLRIVGELAARGALDADEEDTPGAGRAPDTVGELLEVWIVHQRRRFENSDRSPHTLRLYETSARHLVKWLRDVRPVRLAALNRSIVEGYVSDREAEQLARRRALAAKRAKTRLPTEDKEVKITTSPRTIRQEIRTLAAAWKWGREAFRDFPQRDFPAVRVDVDEGTHVYNHHTPTAEEIVAVLAHLKPGPRLAVEVLAETGARVSEVTSAKVGDFNRVTRDLALTGKTGARVWPCSSALADRLEAACEGRDPDEPLVDLGSIRDRRGRILDALRRACAHAKVPRFTPHGLRRAAVRRARRRGIDVKVAASLFGHSELVMLKLYDAVSDDERREAVRRARMGVLVEEEQGRVIEGPWKG